MKKYIAPEIELIRFLGNDVLATSSLGSNSNAGPQNIDVDNEGWINYYPQRPRRSH